MQILIRYAIILFFVLPKLVIWPLFFLYRLYIKKKGIENDFVTKTWTKIRNLLVTRAAILGDRWNRGKKGEVDTMKEMEPGKPGENRSQSILHKLARHYPNAETALNYGSIFQLLVAVMLSAQTTDKQVNKVTGPLFQKYQTPGDFASLNEEELAERIKGCGLYRTKARNIIHASQIIIRDFRGRVPSTLEELLTLPGVGRKTANVVLSVAYEIPALAVDTHVFRVSGRLGLAKGKNPEETEGLLRRVVPRESWKDAHHWLIYHGRSVCTARNPGCHRCFLQDECPEYGTLLLQGVSDGQKKA